MKSEVFNSVYEAEIFALNFIAKNNLLSLKLSYGYVKNNDDKVIRLNYFVDDKIIMSRYCRFEFNENGERTPMIYVEYDDTKNNDNN